MVKALLLLLLMATTAAAQLRPKPVFDPETKEGLLIQYIQQEKDPAAKLRYLEQFAGLYPSHPAVAWVYGQLQPTYFEGKELEQVMRIGALLVGFEPENLEAAKLSLQAAEAVKDPDRIIRWADLTWQIASKLAAQPGLDNATAKRTQAYAESCWYSVARQTTDPRARLVLLQALEQRNPLSPYLENLASEYFEAYRQLGDTEKALAMAQKTLWSDPNNVDMLMAIADHLFRTDNAREKVVAYSTKVIGILQKKPSDKSTSQLLGTAYYMAGISSSLLTNYLKADKMLRSALNYLRENQALEAAALYHLGVANYKLTGSGNLARSRDALQFMRRCAAIKSPFQAQAVKSAEAIKSEYNLQ